jgi:hypothetical protein
MMQGLTPQVTKSVDEVSSEVGSDKPAAILHSQRFWSACQAGRSPHEALVKAGFEIEFQANSDREIETVTFRLNETWTAIMQRAVERRGG